MIPNTIGGSDHGFSTVLESVQLRQEKLVRSEHLNRTRQKRIGLCVPTRRLKPLPGLPCLKIYLDKYMLCGVYEWSGICVRNHCGAEPPRDIEPPGLVPAVGWRDRASASYAAADRVKAPASAARGRFRGIHGGRTAPSLSTETRTVSGGRCLADSVPPVLVRSCRCSRTPPRPHGSINTNEKEDKEKIDGRSRYG